MSTSERPYHHGDLRAALVSAAAQMLEAGEPYSMRAVARQAGVSPAAPYRHFADRDALDSAVAVEGFADLNSSLAAALESAEHPQDPVRVIGDLGLAYVQFALRRPALFRLMFGNACDEADNARVQAAQGMHDLLGEVLERLVPQAASPRLATALWGMAHGLAFLHLDGKYRPEPAHEVAERVHASVAAVVGLGRAVTPSSTLT